MVARRDGESAVAHVIRGSMYGVIAVGLNGLGGLVFWTVLARSELASTVGSAQQLFTAVLVVSYLTTLGLPVSVARFCTDASGRSAALFRRATAATAASSVVGALLLWAFAGEHVLAPLGSLDAIVRLLVLAGATAGLSLAVLVEIRLIALRQWGWVLGRVAAVVLLRFPLLAVSGGDRALWAFLLVAGLPALSGAVGAVALHHLEPHPALLDRVDRRAWRRFGAVNYVGLLASQGPQFLIPLVVALSVDDAAFAPFYLAWGAAAFVFVVPHLLGQMLLAESSRPTPGRGAVAVGAGLSVAVTAAATVASFGVAPALRGLLGPEYAATVPLLPWLIGAAVPWSLTCTTLAVARSRCDDRAVLGVTGAFAVVAIAGAMLGVAVDGIQGAAVGWFVANWITGVASLATVLPWRARRGASPAVVLGRSSRQEPLVTGVQA